MRMSDGMPIAAANSTALGKQGIIIGEKAVDQPEVTRRTITPAAAFP